MLANHEARLCFATQGKINVKMSTQDQVSCLDRGGCLGGLCYIGAARMYKVEGETGQASRADSGVGRGYNGGGLNIGFQGGGGQPGCDPQGVVAEQLKCVGKHRAGIEDWCMKYTQNDHLGTGSTSEKAQEWTRRWNQGTEMVVPTQGFSGNRRCGDMREGHKRLQWVLFSGLLDQMSI